jgi:hypothetical protein
MPIVNGKHYPYTRKGIASAKKERARKKKKGFHWSNVHVKEVKHPWVY